MPQLHRLQYPSYHFGDLETDQVTYRKTSKECQNSAFLKYWKANYYSAQETIWNLMSGENSN